MIRATGAFSKRALFRVREDLPVTRINNMAVTRINNMGLGENDFAHDRTIMVRDFWATVGDTSQLAALTMLRRTFASCLMGA
jgi:hypothetical protein